MKSMDLIQKDLQYIWHPYTQHLDMPEPVPIVKGKGALLYDDKGTAYIDAISSWWVNLHGHGHPYIARKIYEQASQLEHVIFAGFTHPPAVTLAERLIQLFEHHFSRVFYSDNGSTAVEVAVKMAYQYWKNKGKNRPFILAFDEAYHGDTVGAMSVSACSLFTQAFAELMFDVKRIPFPQDDGSETITTLKKWLNTGKTGAFIFEPLVLGAAGMKMYREEVLQEMNHLCREYEVITIADEVFTGFGRTGQLFATRQLSPMPDIICLSKGLTGGFLPMGATLCTDAIYRAFLSNDRTKTFFHGHSYTANPLGCAAGLASLDLLLEPMCMQQIQHIVDAHRNFSNVLRDYQDVAGNIRQCGTIFALDINASSQGYLSNIRDYIWQFFINRKALLRPLGNVVYILPPYCIEQQQLDYIYNVILELLNELRHKMNSSKHV